MTDCIKGGTEDFWCGRYKGPICPHPVKKNKTLK